MNYMNAPANDAANPYMFTPSPLVNQHRRVFSNFSADGAPLPPNAILPGLFADDLAGFELGDGNDHGDPKRRRIARACDMCRKKKIKCDGKMPACTHCQNYKTECIFTQVEKKRNPPKGHKYIEGLENRLGRMESLLRLSGILSDEDAGATDLGTLEKRLADRASQVKEKATTEATEASSGVKDETSSSGTPRPGPILTPRSGETSPEPPRSGRSEEEVEVLSDMMCSLVTNNCGETRYIGSSSGFSIFSPKGIQWVNEKTGDTSFQEMIQGQAFDENKWVQWRPEVFRDIFQRRVYLPLPPKIEALSLLKDYFENFNCMFPLFHEPTFYHLVDKHYSRDPYEGSGWWASLNVALAIAHRLRVMSNLVPQEEDQKAWGYLKNAMAVMTELTIRNTDLLSVQALLGMSLFLQGTPNPQPSFFLVAAAIRLSHSIGLHKRGSGFNLNQSETEQRKRVFWISYMVDRDICLRSGRPPIQDDDDMNVDLPSEDPPDNVGNIPLADGNGKVNLFRLMCRFSVIASKVYKQLYSVKASRQSDGELLNTIGELDRELEEWKDGIPLDFRPEHEIKANHTPLILHVVVLHFAYYNCLTTIHRMSVHHGYWTSRLSNYAIQGLNARPLNPRVFSSAALCVSAARASINLIKYIPQGDYDCVWLILYYPVSALVTLFANILQNPQDGRARSDLKLMNQVVGFLNTLCNEDNNSIKRMLSVCAEFERIARVVLDKADKETSSRRKRKQQENREASVISVSSASSGPQQTASPPSQRGDPDTPKPSQPGNIPNVFSPPPNYAKYLSEDNFQNLSTLTSNLSSAMQDLGQGTPAMANWLSPRAVPSSLPTSGASSATTATFDFGTGPPSATTSPQATSSNRTSVNSTIAPNGVSMAQPTVDPMDMGNSFTHPFIPQDLWQMPMTLEWDWADMTAGSGFGAGFDDGMGMNGTLTDLQSSIETDRR